MTIDFKWGTRSLNTATKTLKLGEPIPREGEVIQDWPFSADGIAIVNAVTINKINRQYLEVVISITAG